MLPTFVEPKYGGSVRIRPATNPMIFAVQLPDDHTGKASEERRDGFVPGIESACGQLQEHAVLGLVRIERFP
jgi:hypothetical protein